MQRLVNIENDLLQVPNNFVSEENKKQFLEILSRLKINILARAPHEILIRDINGLNLCLLSLAKEGFYCGYHLLNARYQAILKQLKHPLEIYFNRKNLLIELARLEEMNHRLLKLEDILKSTAMELNQELDPMLNEDFDNLINIQLSIKEEKKKIELNQPTFKNAFGLFQQRIMKRQSEDSEKKFFQEEMIEFKP